MKDSTSRYTLRVSQRLLDLFGYVAQYENRSKNKEIERLMRKRIKEFENEHGPITKEMLDKYLSSPKGTPIDL